MDEYECIYRVGGEDEQIVRVMLTEDEQRGVDKFIRILRGTSAEGAAPGVSIEETTAMELFETGQRDPLFFP